MTTRTVGGLDFTAIGGKRQGREVPQSLRVWKTQSRGSGSRPNQLTGGNPARIRKRYFFFFLPAFNSFKAFRV